LDERTGGFVRLDMPKGTGAMGADRLDAQLEPLAQFLLLIILLVVVAAVSTYIIIKASARRNERRHRKLSASKRLKETGINLLPRSDEDPPAPQHSRRRRSSRSSSNLSIDILKRPEKPSVADDPNPVPPETQR
jgi:hypothetical protein